MISHTMYTPPGRCCWCNASTHKLICIIVLKHTSSSSVAHAGISFNNKAEASYRIDYILMTWTNRKVSTSIRHDAIRHGFGSNKSIRLGENWSTARKNCDSDGDSTSARLRASLVPMWKIHIPGSQGAGRRRRFDWLSPITAGHSLFTSVWRNLIVRCRE